jgi:hypothetical protein
MFDQRVKVRIKIHPFRFTLLLIYVRDPDQRCTPPRECLTNLRNEKVRDQARVEASRPKDKQVSITNRIKSARSGLDRSYV